MFVISINIWNNFYHDGLVDLETC